VLVHKKIRKRNKNQDKDKDKEERVDLAKKIKEVNIKRNTNKKLSGFLDFLLV
jgi:hypothetical protein